MTSKRDRSDQARTRAFPPPLIPRQRRESDLRVRMVAAVIMLAIVVVLGLLATKLVGSGVTVHCPDGTEIKVNTHLHAQGEVSCP